MILEFRNPRVLALEPAARGGADVVAICDYFRRQMSDEVALHGRVEALQEPQEKSDLFFFVGFFRRRRPVLLDLENAPPVLPLMAVAVARLARRLLARLADPANTLCNW